MKRLIIIIISIGISIGFSSAQRLAGAEDSGMPANGSDIPKRWYPPALSQTRDNKVSPVPLATIISSVQLSTAPEEVVLSHLRGIVVSVHNGTDCPLIVDADKAVATSGGAAYNSARTEQIDKAACPENAPAKKVERGIVGVVLAAVTIGAAQAARDVAIQKGPVLHRYGCDEARRHDETEVFGRRVIWPGDTRKGIIYFDSGDSLHGVALKIPVRALFNPGDQVMMTLQL